MRRAIIAQQDLAGAGMMKFRLLVIAKDASLWMNTQGCTSQFDPCGIVRILDDGS